MFSKDETVIASVRELVKDFIIEVVGLENAAFYEKINIANKAIGYVTKLESNHAIIAVLTQTEKIAIGDEVYQTNEEFMGDYSSDSLGRIVDIFIAEELLVDSLLEELSENGLGKRFGLVE